jgi:Ni2+-binding GTPase involved in maturation of urease and hydrogenase
MPMRNLPLRIGLYSTTGDFTMNLMASPAQEKPSLIESTLNCYIDEMRVAVIDGDIASNIDADRAAAAVHCHSNHRRESMLKVL